MNVDPPVVSQSLLKTSEAAELLRCCTKTVTNLINRGFLRSVYLGKAVRIERAELERFIAQGGGR